MVDRVRPDWPAPANVQAFSTTRKGGVSRGPWSSFNLGDNSGDELRKVRENRRLLQRLLPSEPLWLTQVHGRRVVAAGDVAAAREAGADAVTSRIPGQVCAVLSADCLPVLLCDREGTRVAAAHAGWRGLAAGVLEATVSAMGHKPEDLMAWLGPAIGPQVYEVGTEVFDAFVNGDAGCTRAFRKRGDSWLANLYLLASIRLASIGVQRVYGGGFCTYSDSNRFYSYRRDGVTGRMATLIWLTP